MPETFIPSGTTDVADLIKWAAAEGKPLSLHGHRSKAGLGRPAQTEYALDIGRLSGILDYEPAELVLTLRPGTLVSDVEKLLGADNAFIGNLAGRPGPIEHLADLFSRGVGKGRSAGVFG